MPAGEMRSASLSDLGRPASLTRRFWTYQAERFPILAYAPLVAVFTFSAAAYSRVLRGAPGFIPPALYAVGCLTTLVFFFCLRVLDEHKDQATDRRFRPELPVPRGLISLPELRGIALAALAAVFLLNTLLAPRLLVAMLVVALWAGLMTKEFFVRRWLRVHPTAYLLSHMLIMPMVDAYTTGLDWLVAGDHPRGGLWLFLIITFLNGCLLEIGRKLRAPEQEREGVDTYTRAWGVRGALVVWLAVLAAAGTGTWLAARALGTGVAAPLLVPLLLSAAYPALRFLRETKPRWARAIDTVSGVWTLITYLFLGAGPFLMRATGPA